MRNGGPVQVERVVLVAGHEHHRRGPAVNPQQGREALKVPIGLSITSSQSRRTW
jgi:hypothetical protein